MIDDEDDPEFEDDEDLYTRDPDDPDDRDDEASVNDHARCIAHARQWLC